MSTPGADHPRSGETRTAPAGPRARVDPLGWLTGAAGLYLLVFLLVPLGLILGQSVQILAAGGLAEMPGFAAWLLRLTRNSLLLAGIVTAVTLAVSMPLALWVVKAVPYRPLFTALLTLPLLSPPFMASFATILLLGRTGVVTQLLARLGLPPIEIYGLPGIAFTHVVHAVPLAFLTLAAGLRTVPKSVEESALSLGGTLPQVALRVVLPYLRPYILMAGLLVFLVSFGDVGAPLLVGGNYRVLPVEAYTAFVSFTADPRVPVLLSGWLILISLLLLHLVRGQMRRTEIAHRFTAEVHAYRGRPPPTAGFLYSSLIGALLLAPYAAIVVASLGTVWSVGLLPDGFTLRHYQELARSLEPLGNSLLLAAMATPVAVGLALVLGRAIRATSRWGGLLDSVALLPFVVSGVVIGIGLIRMTTSLHALGLALPFLSGPALLVVAYSVRRLPYPMRVLAAGYGRIDRRQEEASHTLGASPLRAYCTVTLPQLYPAILAASIIAFIRILTELGATLMVYRPGWATIALQIFHYAQEGFIGRAAAVSVLLMALVGVLALLANVDYRRFGDFLRRRAAAGRGTGRTGQHGAPARPGAAG